MRMVADMNHGCNCSSILLPRGAKGVKGAKGVEGVPRIVILKKEIEKKSFTSYHY